MSPRLQETPDKAWQNWCTPKWFLEDHVYKMDAVGLDPCTCAKSQVIARATYNTRQNGLKQSWKISGLAFVNPPYSHGQLEKWAKKIYEEAVQGVEIIALLPSRTDTLWMHDYIFAQCQAKCFVKGRIRFENGPRKVCSSPKFPSVVAYFGERQKRFYDAFSSLGHVT